MKAAARVIVVMLVMLTPCAGIAEQPAAISGTAQEQAVSSLKEPMYSPFIERYILDELKQLRMDMAQQRHEMMQQILDREHSAVDRGVTYATDTITYFFYLIAAASSLLVLVGWTSIRDIKERVHTHANEEISQLIRDSETRLKAVEDLLNQKTRHIEENREEIELTNDIQALWLRAAQDPSPASKIHIYDQILKLRADDCEALSYKADAVLEIGEPQWAINLCHQALLIDANNGHALYQLACAYTSLKQYEEALHYLQRAIEHLDSYREDALQDKALADLREQEGFRALTQGDKPA